MPASHQLFGQKMDYLLCPSEFVARTFRERGFPESKLLRHQYGFDADDFYPEGRLRQPGKKFVMLFAGQCAVRKGLHFAVEAWLGSPAIADGIFLIAGGFIRTQSDVVKIQTAGGILSSSSARELWKRS